MTHTTSRRSSDLVFSVASEGAGLDPDVNILVRRIAAFRRYFYNEGNNAELMREIYERYKEKGSQAFIGTMSSYGRRRWEQTRQPRKDRW